MICYDSICVHCVACLGTLCHPDTRHTTYTPSHTITHYTHTSEHFALTPAELKTIILEGVKRSFFGGSYLQKRAYVRRFLHYYEVSGDGGPTCVRTYM